MSIEKLNQIDSIEDRQSIAKVLSKIQIDEITTILKDNRDSVKINNLLSQEDFRKYYFQYFKLTPTYELANIFEIDEEDFDIFRKELTRKEGITLRVHESFVISYFLFEKRIPSPEPYNWPFDGWSNLYYTLWVTTSWKSVKWLDYYDNKRDWDSKYKWRYWRYEDIDY